MSAASTKNARVAELNDQLRSRCGVPVFPSEGQVRGSFVMTVGIMMLEPEQIIDICSRVRTFDAFTPDNDPYGEHDFGGFDVEGVGKVFWKIDYYEDHACRYGSEDPADTGRSFRVLTIMLAEEY